MPLILGILVLVIIIERLIRRFTRWRTKPLEQISKKEIIIENIKEPIFLIENKKKFIQNEQIIIYLPSKNISLIDNNKREVLSEALSLLAKKLIIIPPKVIYSLIVDLKLASKKINKILSEINLKGINEINTIIGLNELGPLFYFILRNIEKEINRKTGIDCEEDIKRKIDGINNKITLKNNKKTDNNQNNKLIKMNWILIRPIFNLFSMRSWFKLFPFGIRFYEKLKIKGRIYYLKREINNKKEFDEIKNAFEKHILLSELKHNTEFTNQGNELTTKNKENINNNSDSINQNLDTKINLDFSNDNYKLIIPAKTLNNKREIIEIIRLKKKSNSIYHFTKGGWCFYKQEPLIIGISSSFISK